MPTQKQGKAVKASGSSAPPVNEHAALEEERMQVISAWMYEHCSRYGLDEALQGDQPVLVASPVTDWFRSHSKHVTEVPHHTRETG